MPVQVSFILPDTINVGGTEYPSDAVLQNAFVNAYPGQWTEEIADPDNPGEMIPNPETKEDFVHKKIMDYVQDIVNSRNDAIVSAEQSVRDTIASLKEVTAQFRKEVRVQKTRV